MPLAVPAFAPRVLVLVATAVGVVSPAFAGACLAPADDAILWLSGERNGHDLVGVHNGTAFGDLVYVSGIVGEGFRFDGVDDGIATDTTIAEQRTLREAFTYEFWARPDRPLGTCAQSNGSNCSGADLAWAVFPLHGDAQAPGEEIGDGAGIGIAVGTDGVCVGEHAPFLVDCLARIDTPLDDWTHIAVVVEDRTPRIYLDGQPAHVGIASAKAFVFASWFQFGHAAPLGNYRGDLDEVTLYGRALQDEDIAALFAAGSTGKCRPECARQRSDDAWQGASVTAHSGLRSSAPDGMFGAQDISPETDSTLFADGVPEGTVHSIEWETADPVLLAGFGIFAMHDPLDNPIRAFRHLVLQARAEADAPFQTLYAQPVLVPYGANSRELVECVNLRPGRWRQFRAEFTQGGAAGFSGPRVMELDAIALPDLLFEDGFEP